MNSFLGKTCLAQVRTISDMWTLKSSRFAACIGRAVARAMSLPQSAMIWSDQYFHWGLLEPGVAAAARREELERFRRWKRFRVECRWMQFTLAYLELERVAAAVVPTRELAGS